MTPTLKWPRLPRSIANGSPPTPDRQTRSIGRAGFTLSELLVVLGILSILMALLLPALARTRAASRESVCASNLRQVGAGFLMYLADYDEALPYAIDPWRKLQNFPDQGEPWYKDIPRLPTFPEVMKPYLSDLRVLSCPSDTGLQDEQSQGRTRYAQYGMSFTVADSYGLSGKRLGDFLKPAETGYMTDSGLRWHSLIPRSETTLFDIRGNTLFLDGHVKLVTLNDILAAKGQKGGQE